MSLVSGIANVNTTQGSNLVGTTIFAPTIDLNSIYATYPYQTFTPEKIFGKDYAEEFKEKTDNSKQTTPTLHSKTQKNTTGTVAMKDLNLKGTIAGCNSKPYIASRNSENLIALDDYLAKLGYTVIYTSAMGGHTKGGHVKGNKVDFQLYKNGKPAHLTNAELKELKDMGYYGKGTGAVGWEPHANQNTGGHYDICIA